MSALAEQVLGLPEVVSSIAPPKRRAPRATTYRAESSTANVRAPGPRIQSSDDVWRHLRDIASQDREHMVVIHLNVRNQIMARPTIAIGSATGVDAHPREVFRAAIMAGAAAIILAHNHPSGDPTPSRLDIEMTQRLRDAGELVGIPVLDHVVVAERGYISLAERGWK